jgi:hypothetical protein
VIDILANESSQKDNLNVDAAITLLNPFYFIFSEMLVASPGMLMGSLGMLIASSRILVVTLGMLLIASAIGSCGIRAVTHLNIS